MSVRNCSEMQVRPRLRSCSCKYWRCKALKSQIKLNTPPEIEADCEEVTLNSVTTTSLLVSWLPIQESETVQESLVVSPAPCRAGLSHVVCFDSCVTASISQVFLLATGRYKGTKTLYLSKSMLPYVTPCYPLTLCCSM